jgi:uncharacterized protein
VSTALRSPVADDYASMLALNNAFSAETSLLSSSSLEKLIDASFYTRVSLNGDAFCIALDHNSHHEGINFNWFRQRYRRFVYIDRIVVVARAHGKGLARAIYLDLKKSAIVAGHDTICCEVNVDPPNVRSDRFHEGFGFVEVGKALLSDRAKTVRYLELRI